MNIKTIYKLQREYGLAEMQEAINTGMAWKMEGRIGRKCMDLLSNGVCFLPLQDHYDYWGNEIPSRNKVANGSLGSLSLAKSFWSDDIKVTDFFDCELYKQLFI